MKKHELHDDPEGIAIIGMAGRFPGARNTSQFWLNLRDGVEATTFFTDAELAARGIDSSVLSDPAYVKAKPLLDDVEMFDAAFFGYTQREAEIIDPQQRLFLECAWESLENAGYEPEKYQGSIGVYAGVSMNTYMFNLFARRDVLEAMGSFQMAISNDKDYLPTRVSYKLNLRGPSIAVQTACSTSLVAVHVACQSLLNGECDMALAGGTTVQLPQKAGYHYKAGGINSPDGHCRAFDSKAQGTLSGNGVGVVVLKRLGQALSDGDHIEAIIKGSAINNDGAYKVGFTSPAIDGQAEVITEALSVAGVDPETITYVEAHGTGTQLGDPIEIAALTQAFQAKTRKKQFCAIGSVKTNIGHLDAAAGVVGLIKTVLALKHKSIPPSLHFTEPNPEIDFADSPFYVNTKLSDWTVSESPRRAGVSSFGIGGTNAHVVLEEAPQSEVSYTPRKQQLLILSGKSSLALESVTGRLIEHLKQSSGLNLTDVAFTLQTGRRSFQHRRMVVCEDVNDALTALQRPNSNRVLTAKLGEENQSIAFMFPGQGTQHVGMGFDLYKTVSTFRRHVDDCAERLKPHLKVDLRDVIYPGDAKDADATQLLKQTSLTQPALFVIEYGLAQMWIEWGIKPQALIGHSVGEYVAACLANVFSLDDALTLVAARGQLMQGLPAGAMLAVPLPAVQVQYLLGDKLSIAAVNSHNSCVVSGVTEAIKALEQSLKEKKVRTQLLQTSHAFHSEMVIPILQPFTELVKKVKLNAPTLPYLSNVTGTWITDAEATDPHYWARHLRQTVRFADGVQNLLREKNRLLLEVGPGRTLSALVMQNSNLASHTVFSTLSHPKERISDEAVTLSTLGRFWLNGKEVDWNSLHVDDRCRRVALPTYPFERKRCWIDPPATPEQQMLEQPTMKQAIEHSAPSTSALAQAEESHVPEPQISSIAQPQRYARILETLKGIVHALTGIAPAEVKIDATFFELGVSSLLLIQAGQQVKNKLGVEVSLVQFFEDLSTLDALATYIDTELPPEEVMPTEQPTIALEPMEGLSPENSQRAINIPAAPLALATANENENRLNETLDQIVKQQLQVMSQQLELLRENARLGKSVIVSESLKAPQTTAIQRAVESQSKHVVAPRQRAPEVPLTRDEVASAEPELKDEFSIYQPVKSSLKRKLTVRQQTHLQSLIERSTKRTQESKKYVERYRPFLADPRVPAGFNLLWKDLIYPIIAKRSQGSKLWDVDGNEYIDLAMGFGVNLFGHSPSFITDALQEQLRNGIHLGPQSNLAGPVAELICELTGMERVIFCNSGTEAVMAALRIARTVTGRNKVALFAGSYHGSFDGTLARGLSLDGQRRHVPSSPGVMQGMIDDVLVLDYGSDESLEVLKAHKGELAAVLVEPVQSRQPHLQPKEFLHQLRQLTAEVGTALIFDEVITGFRAHPAGAQGWFGVQADMTTYGKVVGGGMPIGVVAGTSVYMNALDGGMWQFGDASFPRAQQTFFAGTFCKHPLAMTAAWAVLNHLKEQGPGLQETLNKRTTQLVGALENYFEQEELPIQVANFSSLFYFRFPRQERFADLFFYHMVDKGIYMWEGHTCFLSTAHTEEDVKRVIDAVKETTVEMREGELLTVRANKPEPPADVQTKRVATVAAHSGSGNGNSSVSLLMTAEPNGPSAPEAEKDSYTAPMTAPQKQLCLAAQMGPGASRAYNESFSLHLRGPFDLPSMKKALQRLVDRHEALRTTFSHEENVQHISTAVRIEISFHDLSTRDEQQRDEAMRALVDEAAQQEFDLTLGPLFRSSVIKVAAQYHLLVLTAHHIAADGRSLGVMLGELEKLYAAEIQGTPAALTEPMQFNEYAERQAEQQTSGPDNAEDYWLKQFAGTLPVLELPADHPRPPVKTYQGDRQSITIGAALSRELLRASAQCGTTLYLTLLASFQVLLHRLSGQNDIIVGTPAVTSLALGDNHIVGHTINFLPLRSSLAASQSFAEYVRSLRRVVSQGYEHQEFSFGDLVQKLNLKWDPSRSPLVSAAFNLDRGSKLQTFADLSAELISNQTRTSKFDFGLNIFDTDGELLVDCDYSTDLFETATIQRWLGHWTTLLQSIAENPEQRISDLPLMNEQERGQWLIERNRTEQKYPHDACLHELFEAQAARTPAAVAVVFEDRQIKYEELNRRANQLAHYLRGQGVGAEVLVGLCMDRGIDMIVGMLGILKAGGAYLPLDPSYPRERLSFMIKDSRAELLLTQQNLRETFAKQLEKIVCLDSDWESIAQESDENLSLVTMPESLAYVIYTSGSTGRPNGVLVTHRGVCNNISYSVGIFQVEPPSRLLQFSSFSFDAAVLEIFMALTTGASLHLLSKHDTVTGPDLTRLLQTQAITTAVLTPSVVALLSPANLPALRTVSVGGESCSKELAAQWSTDHRLLNCYGPTETTIYVSVQKCDRDYPLDPPLGGPIANTQIYLLDRNHQPVAVGVRGEICIGGVSLARGYINRPSLTASRFVPNPFGESPGGRLYKTGDLASYLPDGNIQFLGRIDDQIKLRGFRIQLSEIEGVLKQHPAVRRAVVTFREHTPGDNQLVAYVSTVEDHQLTGADLRRYLKQWVPDYMIPQTFMMLENLPVTSQGKVARGNLPAPHLDRLAVEVEFVAPRNQIEHELTRIWSEVLGVNQIGVNDSFFELGGHSLMAMQVVSRVRESFRIEVDLRQLLETPTIAEMAATVALTQVEHKDRTITNIPRAPRGDQDLDQLLAELDGLSEDEVLAQLVAETA